MQRPFGVSNPVLLALILPLAFYGCSNSEDKSSGAATTTLETPAGDTTANAGDVTAMGPNRQTLKCIDLEKVNFDTILSPADPRDPIPIRFPPAYGHVLKVPKSALNGPTTFRIRARAGRSPRVTIAVNEALRPNAVLLLDLNYKHCKLRAPDRPRGGFYSGDHDGSTIESGTDNPTDERVENIQVLEVRVFGRDAFVADTLYDILATQSGYAVASN